MNEEINKLLYRIKNYPEKLYCLDEVEKSILLDYITNLQQQNEINRLNNIINECADEILKELQENHHLSYGVALAIRQKLINYRELKGE